MERQGELNTSFKNFDRFVVAYSIEGIIVNESPLHIGSGRSQVTVSAADNPVLMTKRGEIEVPVIPGSSWKGLLRSEAERFVRSTEKLKDKYGEVWRACDVLGLTESEDLRQEEETNPCAVCRVFGNTGVASHVRTFDSYPLGEYSLELISRVAIDRITGGQSPGRFFKVQVVSPMTEWGFKMQIINIDLSMDAPEKEIITYLLGRLISGLQIGGGKSVGYGLVKLREDSVRVKETRIKEGKLVTESYEGRDALRGMGV